MSERDWSSAEYRRARAEGQELEALMRSILRLFAEGHLVYRDRTQRSGPVETKSDRLKRLRRSLGAAVRQEPGAASAGAA